MEWRQSWTAAERAAEQRAREALLSAQRKTLEEENAALRAKLAAVTQEAELSGASSAAELKRLMAAQEEEAREKRVADLMKLASRRISKLSLSRGWLTWLSLYEEQQWTRCLLAKAAGRLTRPKLAACFVEWRRDWEVCEREAAQRQLLESHAEQKRAVEKQVEALRDELAAALSAVQNGTADRAEMERLMAAAEEQAREQRVADLMSLAGRRLTQLALSRGWLTWLGLWEEQSRHQRMLRGAAGRLMKPKLSACFMEWRQSWTAAEREAAAARHAQLVSSRGDMAADLKLALAEAAQAKAALADALSRADAGGDEVASIKQMLLEQQEAAREKRVADLQQLAARRITQLSLARGWSTWLSYYETEQWARRMMQKTAGRMMKPYLVACFVEWRRDWEACEREAVARQQRESLKGQAEHSRLAKELAIAKSETEMARASYEDEKRAYIDKSQALSAQREASEVALSVERAKLEDATAAARGAIDAEIEKAARDAEERVAAAEQRLARELGEQRTRFEDELAARSQEKAAAEVAWMREREELQRQIDELSKRAASAQADSPEANAAKAAKKSSAEGGAKDKAPAAKDKASDAKAKAAAKRRGSSLGISLDPNSQLSCALL